MKFETSPHIAVGDPRTGAPSDPPPGAWLLLAEMNHRIANEYALAMSSVSLAARRAAPEAQADLLAVRNRLRDYAEAHRALLPPTGESADLSDYLAGLCLSVVRATLAERGVSLRFIAAPYEMSSEACWRVGLIVSELITNAVRHGRASPGATITVELRASAGGVDCAVRNTGGSATPWTPGRGTLIIEGIAKELGARINRCFGRTESCVVLSLEAGPAPC